MQNYYYFFNLKFYICCCQDELVEGEEEDVNFMIIHVKHTHRIRSMKCCIYRLFDHLINFSWFIYFHMTHPKWYICKDNYRFTTLTKLCVIYNRIIIIMNHNWCVKWFLTWVYVCMVFGCVSFQLKHADDDSPHTPYCSTIIKALLTKKRKNKYIHIYVWGAIASNEKH